MINSVKILLFFSFHFFYLSFLKIINRIDLVFNQNLNFKAQQNYSNLLIYPSKSLFLFMAIHRQLPVFKILKDQYLT